MQPSQNLILSVRGDDAERFGNRSEKVFDGCDGSIGRSEDCDWVLAAEGVSRVHALVRHINGIYFIEDRSTNGMLLNGAPLPKGDPSALNDGDLLQIDSFEVTVRMDGGDRTLLQPRAATPPTIADSPVSLDLLDLAPAGQSLAGGRTDDLLIPGTSGEVARPAEGLDPLSFFESPYTLPEATAEPRNAPAASWNHTPSTADRFHPPLTDVRRQAQSLPEHWDQTMFEPAKEPAIVPPPELVDLPAAPMPEPTPAAPPAKPAVPTGIEPLFRIVIDGLMDVLRARAELKNRFRLPVTIIRRTENNPLKFAATADDAMEKLLAPSNSAFLSGAAALDDALDDIRYHQMAMLAGVRAAFEALLAQFDPTRFELEAGKSGRLSFGHDRRVWDAYRKHFQALQGDPDECFRRLFGDEFARAYEVQLARLKSARGTDSPANR